MYRFITPRQLTPQSAFAENSESSMRCSAKIRLTSAAKLQNIKIKLKNKKYLKLAFSEGIYGNLR